MLLYIIRHADPIYNPDTLTTKGKLQASALAKRLAMEEKLTLVSIDGNLLKEGEIGGLPTIEEYEVKDDFGNISKQKATVYAIHTKLKKIDEEINKGRNVLLFIDEINRCEHAVQQELMNLILNREINGYNLPSSVKILAAMNPSGKYGEDFDYAFECQAAILNCSEYVLCNRHRQLVYLR